MPPEPEPCIVNVTGAQAIIHSNDVKDRKILAEKEGFALDCMWTIQVKEGWKVRNIYINVCVSSFNIFLLICKKKLESKIYYCTLSKV